MVNHSRQKCARMTSMLTGTGCRFWSACFMVRACAVHASRHGDTHCAAGARAVRAGRGARRRHRALDRRRPRGTGRHRGEPAHVRRVPGGAARRRAGDTDRRCAAAAARRARRDRGRQRHRPGAHRFRLRLTSRPRPPTPRRCGGCARQTRCGRRRPRPSALHRGLSYTWSWTVLGRAERERPGGRSHLRRCHGRTHGDVDDSGVPLGARLMGPPSEPLPVALAAQPESEPGWERDRSTRWW